jgi:hypothetical protein
VPVDLRIPLVGAAIDPVGLERFFEAIRGVEGRR